MTRVELQKKGKCYRYLYLLDSTHRTKLSNEKEIIRKAKYLEIPCRLEHLEETFCLLLEVYDDSLVMVGTIKKAKSKRESALKNTFGKLKGNELESKKKLN